MQPTLHVSDEETVALGQYGVGIRRSTGTRLPRLGLDVNGCIPPARVTQAPTPGLHPESEANVDGQVIRIHAKDLKRISRLGSGKYGYVDWVRHTASGKEFAVKHITIQQRIETMANLERDLGVGQRCFCEYLILCYCGLYYEFEILVVMELMDASLDKLIVATNKANRRIFGNILSYIAYGTVVGLEYLHRELKVIHRDVKPSNILTNRRGEIKVCDYGISGDLIDSHAKTYLGNSSYLAPERIHPSGDGGYRIQSDVWSLGLTVIELATGKPFYSRDLSVFETIDLVVVGDPPSLPNDGQYPDALMAFVSSCLVKDEQKRADYVALLQMDFLHIDVPAAKEAMCEFVKEVLPKN